MNEPSPLSTAAIADYAERVGEHHHAYDHNGRLDLDHLVRVLGGRVEESHTFIAKEALTVRSRGDFTIHLPLLTSDRRDRFTIAHELGHYFLHYLQAGHDGELRFGRGERNRVETQANYFAASLLMPSEPFRRAHRRLRGDAWALADLFGVSPKSAEVRAEVLGL